MTANETDIGSGDFFCNLLSLEASLCKADPLEIRRVEHERIHLQLHNKTLKGDKAKIIMEY